MEVRVLNFHFEEGSALFQSTDMAARADRRLARLLVGNLKRNKKARLLVGNLKRNKNTARRRAFRFQCGCWWASEAHKKRMLVGI